MSRWDSLRKIRRNQAVRDYHTRHPELSQHEIGKVFGITRQRVSQLLKEGDQDERPNTK